MIVDYMPRSLVFDNISRKHFTIEKQIIITDHSYWGTFLMKSDGGKIGNGKSMELQLNDIICIHKSSHQCFQFKLLTDEEIVAGDTNVSKNDGANRGTPRKPTSLAGVNESNVINGKRVRRPKMNDPNLKWS